MREDLEKLRQEIMAAEREKLVLENQLQRLVQKDKHLRNRKDRKRTHRLIQYGVAFEHDNKELEILTDPEVFSLIEKIKDAPGIQALITEAVADHKPLSEEEF